VARWRRSDDGDKADILRDIKSAKRHEG
jgi:hypothetical protein